MLLVNGGVEKLSGIVNNIWMNAQRGIEIFNWGSARRLGATATGSMAKPAVAASPQ